MSLVTHVDRELLRSRKMDTTPLSKIEAFGVQVDTLRWDLQQLGAVDLHATTDILLKSLANSVDECMDNIRTSRDADNVDVLNKLVSRCTRASVKLTECTNRLGTSLGTIVKERNASTLHGVCVEFPQKAKTFWSSIEPAYRKALHKLLESCVDMFSKPMRIKTAKSTGSPVELSAETLKHVQHLARNDHRLHCFLDDTPYGAELYADQLLDLLRRFPHVYVRAAADYMVFNVNTSVLLVLNNWLLSTDAKLLQQLSNGEVPKVAASTRRTPTIRWSYRRADIQPPLGHYVARVTFTSNARTNPEFFGILQQYQAVCVGRNTWDIPIEPGSETADLRKRLKAAFGYPAQVVEILSGPGSFPVKYNYMNRTAMPLWVIKPAAERTSVVRSVDSSAYPWHVLDSRKALLARTKRKADADRISLVMTNATRKARKLASARAALTPKSLRSMQRIANIRHDLVPIADDLRVTARFLVADLNDFVSLHGLLVYQPKVGDVVLHPRLGSVTVKAISTVPQMWLTICTEDGQCHHITLPDLAGRQKTWMPGDPNPLDSEGSEPVDCYLDTPEGAICAPAPLACDDADLTHLQFTTPATPAVQTFVPFENAEECVDPPCDPVVDDVLRDMGQKREVSPHVADRIRKMLQSPSGNNVDDPMLRMVQESGANPAFNQPLETEVDHSSSEDTEVAGPEDMMDFPPGPPFANAPRGPTPYLANLKITQKHLAQYKEVSQELRVAMPVSREEVLSKLGAVSNVSSLLEPDKASSPLSALNAITFELKNGKGNVTGVLTRAIHGMLTDVDAALEYLS